MFDQSVLAALSAKKAFSLKDFLLANQANGCLLGEEAIRKRLRSLIQTGEVMRVGRNAYCIAEKNVGHYRHEYSELAERVAAIVHEEYTRSAWTYLCRKLQPGSCRDQGATGDVYGSVFVNWK